MRFFRIRTNCGTSCNEKPHRCTTHPASREPSNVTPPPTHPASREPLNMTPPPNFSRRWFLFPCPTHNHQNSKLKDRKHSFEFSPHQKKPICFEIGGQHEWFWTETRPTSPSHTTGSCLFAWNDFRRFQPHDKNPHSATGANWEQKKNFFLSSPQMLNVWKRKAEASNYFRTVYTFEGGKLSRQWDNSAE